METPLIGDLHINSMTVTSRYGINGVRDIQLSGKTEPEEECRNTNGSATDAAGDNCTSYELWGPEWCGEFDDEDFRAFEMCCVCQAPVV